MKISVIIPVYNVEKYIARCIASILSQTFQDFEIVIVNDCTPDRSMEIVQQYAEQDKRIKIFENKENLGLMWARMIGYTNAMGDYFVFCDSDDYMPNNALEVLYNAITSTKADIVVGNHTYITTNGKSTIRQNSLKYGVDKEAVYKSLLKKELTHTLWGKIYNNKLFNNYSYDYFKNQTHAEDLVLFYQLIQYVDCVRVIDDCVYNYMQNVLSSSYQHLSDEKLMHIGRAWGIQYSVLSDNKELCSLFEKLKIRQLCRFSIKKYSIKTILNASRKKAIKNLINYTVIRKYYRFIPGVFIYCLLNIRGDK